MGLTTGNETWDLLLQIAIVIAVLVSLVVTLRGYRDRR